MKKHLTKLCEFWLWINLIKKSCTNFDLILILGEAYISNEKKILPNFASTESNKSQIIAFGIGNSSIALVSKFDVEHEYIEKKYGKINDLMTNKVSSSVTFQISTF